MKRYSNKKGVMVENENGGWVKFIDVEKTNQQKINLNHLEPGGSYLRCSKCERKNWNARVNSNCNMTQPNGEKCEGIFIP